MHRMIPSGETDETARTREIEFAAHVGMAMLVLEQLMKRPAWQPSGEFQEAMRKVQRISEMGAGSRVCCTRITN
jgi:hypothetical protein